MGIKHLHILAIRIGLLLVSLPVAAQYQTQILQPNVKTLRLQYLDHSVLQRPYLVLKDGIIDGSEPDNTLEISFDELSHDLRQYTYSVVHLNGNNMPSDLQSYEYLSGFTTQDITDYEYSINTRQDYTHYRFTFPNEDMQLKASGNYAIKIYEDGNPDKIVAIACFSVVEPRVTIQGKVRADTEIEFNGRYQQIDVDILTTGLSIRDPKEITIVVQQNHRLDNQAVINQPTYMDGNRLRYINRRALIFEGGNEYRHFDSYSTYFAGTGIDRILFDRNDYHAILMPDANRSLSPYISEIDADGQFIINAERTADSDTEAEYMWVHWTLPADQPMLDGLLYVGGDLFMNKMNADNLMQYDADAKCYWLTSLVKQGGHDYQYWFCPKGTKKATLQRIEGSHWETENEYTIYVYYRPFSSRHDYLIGISSIR
ncbi:MAG: DUF5103 domain-containing protein [Paludibacteraceae bacterium]|nr:DUF5103 domain-containing protein [Paludibacteraceae bacterium]